jgi:hypothetical protein
MEWLADFAREVDRLAAAEGREARDFACTLLAAIAEPERAAFLQIGDGAIVVGRPMAPDEYACVFWPQRGQYANQTFFATESTASQPLAFERYDELIDEVSLFTDGLQHLVLHEATQTAHAPFFRNVFTPMRGELPGRSEGLSAALASFLDSARVNRRTDDDKTLILATRRPSIAGDPPEARRDGAG